MWIVNKNKSIWSLFGMCSEVDWLNLDGVSL